MQYSTEYNFCINFMKVESEIFWTMFHLDCSPKSIENCLTLNLKEGSIKALVLGTLHLEQAPSPAWNCPEPLTFIKTWYKNCLFIEIWSKSHPSTKSRRQENNLFVCCKGNIGLAICTRFPKAFYYYLHNKKNNNTEFIEGPIIA